MKYRLCYLENGKYIDIPLDVVTEDNVYEIKTIDKFTMRFLDMKSLVTYLKDRNVIDNDVNSLTITIDKKDGKNRINKKIYTGDDLLFNVDENNYNIDFIENWLNDNKYNFSFYKELLLNYIEKYNKNDKKEGYTYMVNFFVKYYRYIDHIIRKPRELTLGDDVIIDNFIFNFIKLELYKVDDDKNRIKDNNGKYIVRDRNMRDLIVLIRKIDKNLDMNLKNKTEELNEIEYEFYKMMEESNKKFRGR